MTDLHEEWIVHIHDPNETTHPQQIQSVDHSVALHTLQEQLAQRERIIQQLTHELTQQRQAASEMARQASHFEQAWTQLSSHVAEKNAYIDALLNGKVMRLLNGLQRLRQRRTLTSPERIDLTMPNTGQTSSITFSITARASIEGWVTSVHDTPSSYAIDISIDGISISQIMTDQSLILPEAPSHSSCFCYELPNECKDEQPHSIRVTIVGSSISYEQIVTLHNSERGSVETSFLKRQLTALYLGQLHHFLANGEILRIPSSDQPVVSIIMVVFNRAELTLQCLRALLADTTMPKYELIIVNNASTDQTAHLLERIEGATILHNRENRHFLHANNQAAPQTKGTYLLLLNNDTQIMAGAVQNALHTIQSSDDIGAVGGKIILMDGRLQEAGSIVWNDGTCMGYGRGDDPEAPMYMFQRDVDYCSGAFLLTKRELFVDHGGFDERFSPAYYEETDYCMRLWQMGQRVVYDPRVKLLHFEFGSSKSTASALQLQREHQSIFRQIHARQLVQHYRPSDTGILKARHARHTEKRILIIDDYVPHPYLGAGFPRAHVLLLSLVAAGYFVTYYPTVYISEPWMSVYSDIPAHVEVMRGYGLGNLAAFLQQRRGYYNIIIISRPDNMRAFQPYLRQSPDLFEQTQVIYDAEALFSLRDVAFQGLQGIEINQSLVQEMIQAEVSLAEGVTSVVCVSPNEAQHFTDAGYSDVHVLSHALAEQSIEPDFAQRRSILMVSSIHADATPNGDGLFWFINDILPHVNDKLVPAPPFVSVGINRSVRLRSLANAQIQITGKVENVAPYYQQARLFVAPTRYSAGIPLKVLEATSYGIPVVTTSLIAEQLGWCHDKELLVADDPFEFAQQCVRLYTDESLWHRIRERALTRLKEKHSITNFESSLKNLLSSVSL